MESLDPQCLVGMLPRQGRVTHLVVCSLLHQGTGGIPLGGIPHSLHLDTAEFPQGVFPHSLHWLDHRAHSHFQYMVPGLYCLG